MTQQLVNGLVIGSVYALFALGYTLVFGVLDMLNLAHAAVFMLGAFVSLTAVSDLGMPLALAVPFAALVCGLIGILIERVAFRPIRHRADSNLSGLISSIGLAIVLESLALGRFGAETTRFPPDTFPNRVYQPVEGVFVTLVQVMSVTVALALMVGLAWVVSGTRWGREIRAVAESERAARVVGVNVERVLMSTFFLSSLLGGVAGVLFGMQFNNLTTDLGRFVELKGLAAIILGGMGSIPGAVIGGFLLGMTEVFTVEWVGSSWKDAAAFVVIFVILVVRPRGLAGRRAVREV